MQWLLREKVGRKRACESPHKQNQVGSVKVRSKFLVRDRVAKVRKGVKRPLVVQEKGRSERCRSDGFAKNSLGKYIVLSTRRL